MWQPLGIVTPDFNLWLPFPGDAGSGTVFRLQFISDGKIENVFSYLWLRRVWVSGILKEKEVEPSQKFYPQINSVILWLPIPPAFTGLTPVGYEIHKDYRYRKGSYAEPNWYVSLDVFE